MDFSSSRRQFLIRSGTLVAGLAAWQGSPLLAADGIPSGGGSKNDTPLAPPGAQPPKLEVPEKAAKTAGWAIVGLGELALGEIMPAFGLCKLSEPAALVSGHPDKAKKVAAAYGLKPEAIYNYENFDEISKNPEIEIVYIVLPNSMHAEYTIRALKAGKHVLCEKPLSVTVKESEDMIAAAREADRQLMTAYRLHYEPFNQKVIEVCQKKELGSVKTFSAFNCQNVEAPNIRLSAKLGGGPVGDVGVYCINAARYVTGEEPVEVTAIAHQPSDDPRFREVPESVAFTLKFPSGVLADCHCSFGTSESRHYRVNCAEGFIDMDSAFSYTGQQLRIKTGNPKKETASDARQIISPVNHFALQMDHFSDCVLNGKPNFTPGEMGLADMKIAVAIEEAWRTGKSVRLQS